MLIATPIVGFCNCSMFCCALLYVHTSFVTILMGKRELVALLCLSSWCLVIVVWLFLTMPWVCVQFVIVVFPDHTHLHFFLKKLLRAFNDHMPLLLKGFPFQYHLAKQIQIICGKDERKFK